jgi:hypothetical protein
MLNPWFSFGLASARRGLEAQGAFVLSLLRLLGGGPPEPPGRIDITEQIDSAVPESQPTPAVSVPVGRREKAAKRSPGKGKIVRLKTRQAPKRAAAASNKRHAKTLQSLRKGR